MVMREKIGQCSSYFAQCIEHIIELNDKKKLTIPTE